MPKMVDGYIAKREVLLDGSSRQGARDADKPRKEMYFAQIDSPLWYGPLRDTVEQATQDGREYCLAAGVYVPCFGMAVID